MGRFITAPFAWMGGKVRMRRRIYPIFEKCSYRLYVEPFGGSGAVFVGKEKDKNEVYNDWNGVLCNFFRVLRDKEKVAQIKELCNITPSSREFFYELRDVAFAIDSKDAERIYEAKKKALLEDYPDDVAGAFAFFYAQNNSFGGCYLNSFAGGVKSFKDKSNHNSSQVYKNRVGDLDYFCDRFSLVCVDNLDCLECIKRYDETTTLFYCDPPYLCKSSEKYGSGWNDESEKNLVSALIACKGSVVASCYDNENWQVLLDNGFTRQQHEAVSSVSRSKSDKIDIKRIETIYYRIKEKDSEIDSNLLKE